MRPAIKYTGSKRKLLPEVESYISSDITVIVEPFSGSAALSFSKNLPFILGDKSPELINFLQVLNGKYSHLKMINLLGGFKENHSKEFYLKERAADRGPRFDHLPRVYRAARYYYIIYSGFNGLYRVNKSNYCNTPFGDREFKFDSDHLIECHSYMKTYCKGIYYQGFNELATYQQLVNSGEKPFVFIDPPYYNAFTSYTPEGDNGDFYYNLYNFLCDLDDMGIPFLMTNSDHKYINEMFDLWNIEKVTTKCSISADGNSRGTRFESFISNTEKINKG